MLLSDRVPGGAVDGNLASTSQIAIAGPGTVEVDGKYIYDLLDPMTAAMIGTCTVQFDNTAPAGFSLTCSGSDSNGAFVCKGIGTKT